MHKFASKQEIFDAVATGIIGQGGPSVNKAGACKYRGIDGRKCAVGWLIPDELYYLALEFCSLGMYLLDDVLNQVCDLDADRTFDMLRSMRHSHDSEAGLSTDIWFGLWRGRMEVIANNHNLSPAVLGTDMSKWKPTGPLTLA